eukprot:CAMPEP_0172201620 /NCGR_PEP_ID=MMETSP1050-20130122/30129_1 /TAXON_ID=233186 /ORGANISM="Cryptomonas curvata, Strain CCAP979/52" /LENGTH=74 /DNA_ID=CAMNT_0012879343 /DNA_START=390 /DNA_END=614 /DNA_ORIENTATION=+
MVSSPSSGWSTFVTNNAKLGRSSTSCSEGMAERARISRAREPSCSKSSRNSTPPGPANPAATSRLGDALLKPLQ